MPPLADSHCQRFQPHTLCASRHSRIACLSDTARMGVAWLHGHGRQRSTFASRAKPPSRRAARTRLREPAAASGADADAAGTGGLRVRRSAGLRGFSDRQHRVAALRARERRLHRDRGHRQRGPGRHLALHGGRDHAEPRRGAERRRWLPRACGSPQEALRVERRGATPAAALHAGADHPDDADRGVQPPPRGGPAALPLAPADARPAGVGRGEDDAGAHRQHAGCAPRRRHRGGRQAPGERPDRVRPRPHPGAGPAAARALGVRVLRRGQARVRPAAALREAATT